MVDEFDFKIDTAININDLHSEWIRNPGLYGYWASKYADELQKKDKIDLQKKVLKAKLFKEAKLKKDDNGKPYTDTRADNEVHADSQYEKISNELIDAEWRVNRCNANKWAIVQKETSLENITKDDNIGFNMKSGYNVNTSNTIERKIETSEELDKNYRLRLKNKK